jgi:putative spermidine/putrescine transport system substrate-binding protein
MKNAGSTAMVPFSWSGGPYLLLMASAVATGEDFGSDSLDVQAGFDYLEEHVKPNLSTTYGGVASAKQQIASGNTDTILPFWAYMVFDMHVNNSPVRPVWRADPAGIPVAETLVVPEGSDKKEAAMAYVNEALTVEFQETMSAAMGAGVTNRNAEVADVAKQYGVTTPDKFDQLTYPDFGYIWENRSDWSEQWNTVFSG